MENAKNYKIEIGGKEISFQTAKYCGLAHGACWVKSGDTVVMTTAVMSESVRPGIDFFPLSVDYEEKLYSVGKIPGGFKRREGRTDKAVLSARLIDRPLRPLFPKGFFNDVNIVATVLSVDQNMPPEPLAMLGSSFALAISGIPFEGPTGTVSVALVGDKFVVFPNQEERQQSNLNLIVSGTKQAVLMVEASANEVEEKTMLDAIMFAHKHIKQLVEFQENIVKELEIPKREYQIYSISEDLIQDVKNYADKKIDYVLETTDRQERQTRQSQLDAEVKEQLAEKYPEKEREIGDALYNMLKQRVRDNVINKNSRPDGRTADQIRPIWSEVGMLPRVHGSGVFTRGQTQVLTTVTLGLVSEAQKLDGLDDVTEKRYMHQYNMPPYSTGEARNMRAPNRREIGHGALAERALEPVIPNIEEFPYALRLVSEVLTSNGSSSMASVCGSTLALMDAGVGIKAPVAGIAMGLMDSVVLSDIQGLEDFFGDMDFKVAGSQNGITAIQMDIKTHGITEEIIAEALEKAKIGRLHILNEMSKAIDKPREELSKYAPKIIAFKIKEEDIKDVIGSGGKTINKIIAETGVKIDIEDDGSVYILSQETEAANKAKAMIMNIVSDIEVGKIYNGKVVRTAKFGAFVELTPKKDGMIHISKLSTERVEKVEDVVKVGDIVEVEVLKIDDLGRIDLKLIAKI